MLQKGARYLEAKEHTQGLHSPGVAELESTLVECPYKSVSKGSFDFESHDKFLWAARGGGWSG